MKYAVVGESVCVSADVFGQDLLGEGGLTMMTLSVDRTVGTQAGSIVAMCLVSGRVWGRGIGAAFLYGVFESAIARRPCLRHSVAE